MTTWLAVDLHRADRLDACREDRRRGATAALAW
uniref:Uncharacterized protein n=1 Tax=blood disease bacterium R229 TaxID=741978 RepID=G2ZRQ4_9RALS|nr:conserved hypothetical protein [blood disease bacterium R229]